MLISTATPASALILLLLGTVKSTALLYIVITISRDSSNASVFISELKSLSPSVVYILYLARFRYTLNLTFTVILGVSLGINPSPSPLSAVVS